jgi:hypothetical protein
MLKAHNGGVAACMMQLTKVTSAYLKFLDEGIAMYKQLVAKLQWEYGDVGATVEVSGAARYSGVHMHCANTT